MTASPPIRRVLEGKGRGHRQGRGKGKGTPRDSCLASSSSRCPLLPYPSFIHARARTPHTLFGLGPSSRREQGLPHTKFHTFLNSCTCCWSCSGCHGGQGAVRSLACLTWQRRCPLPRLHSPLSCVCLNVRSHATRIFSARWGVLVVGNPFSWMQPKQKTVEGFRRGHWRPAPVQQGRL